MAAILLPVVAKGMAANAFWLSVAGIAGSLIDQAIFAPKVEHQNGPRLNDLQVSGSSYGATIPRVWGRYRLAGNIIWASNLIEHEETTETGGGGKGGGGGGGSYTNYWYSGSFASAICRGPVTKITKIWADNKIIYNVSDDADEATKQASSELSRSMVAYTGAQDQGPSSIIQAAQGIDKTPAYRDVAYVVFNDLSLEKWGNRIPSLNFEVITGTEKNGVAFSQIITDLAKDAGLGEYVDVTEVGGSIAGFSTSSNDYASALAQICRIAGVTWRQYGKYIIFFPWERPDKTFKISKSEIGAGENAEESSFSITRKKEIDLPKSVYVKHLDPDRDYEINSQVSVRQFGRAQRVESIDTGVAMVASQAAKIADRLLYVDWIGRNDYKFKLGPKWLGLSPGDVGDVEFNNYTHSIQLRSVTIGADFSLECEAKAYSRAAFLSQNEGSTGDYDPGTGVVASGGETKSVFLNLPPLLEEHDTFGFYVAATGEASGWRQAHLLQSYDNSSFQYVTTVGEGGVGKTLSVLGDGPTALWDEVNTVDVQLIKAQLESLPQEEVLRGKNAIVIGNEIIQFRTATLIDNKTYRLSGLLRGRRATERFKSNHGIGETVVVAKKCAFVSIPSNMVNAQVYYKLVANDYNQELVSAQVFVCTGETKKPFAPAHPSSEITTNGVFYRWVRRSRLSQELTCPGGEVALNETMEKYCIEVANGQGVIYSTFVYESNFFYSNNLIETHFSNGIPEGTYIRVYQMSDLVGRGNPLVITTKKGGLINYEITDS